MIYILFYALIGLGTGLLTLGREMRLRDRVLTFVTWVLIWPVIWMQIAVIYLRGKNTEKCAWCGQVVGPFMTLKSAIYNEADDRLRTLWRTHYEYDCDKHPLASVVKYERNKNDCLVRQSRGTQLLLFYYFWRYSDTPLSGESVTVPNDIEEQVLNALWFFGWVQPGALKGSYEITDQARHYMGGGK